jgi:hypothetical protein
MVTLDGSETWNVNSATSGLYYTTIANLKDNGLAISNAFEQTTSGWGKYGERTV